MAKEGNKSSGDSGTTRGPCSDCGATDGPFSATIRYRSSGKRTVVRLCPKCYTKV